ncbi:MAG TPA: hypothetical protein VF434_09465 [Promineifilum sp.]
MAKKPAEMAALISALDPASLTANTYYSDWVLADDFEQFMGIVLVGAITTNGTCDIAISQATDGSGTGAKDVVAATQLTAAGTDSNKQVVLQCRQDQLDLAGGFRYLAVEVVTATAASIAGACLLGFNPGYGPARDYDVASVDEIVG